MSQSSPEPSPAALHKEAAAAVPRTGPTSDHYHSALVRYLEAVVADQLDARRPPRRRPPATVVGDVMTRAAVPAHEGMLFKEIVDSLARMRIRALPVIDDERRVVGVVSASDLLDHVAPGTRRRRNQHPHASSARELMTSPAVTTRPHTTIVEATRVAAGAHVRMLPVVDAQGLLVGVVTQADLLRVFLREDEEIREEIEQFALRSMDLDATHLIVTVDEGVVTLAGKLDRALQVGQLINQVRSIPGVVDIDDQLTARYDDRYVPAPHEAR
jgi:CBS-domain-containing membrane protein